MVISTYSNILLSVSLINITDCVLYAAKHGHLDCLKYLHETAKAPWDSRAVRYAHENNQTECVQYLLDNNCALPSVGDTKMESYTACKHRHTHTNFVIHAPRDIHTNENFPIFLYKRRLSLSFACECNRTSGTVVFHVF